MRRCFLGVAALAVTLTCVPAAMATYTGIHRSARGEMSHKQIFASVYGGTFRYAGPNLTNGAITATRITDDQDGVFAAGTYTSRTVASFAAGGDTFGYVQDGEFQQLLAPTGTRTAVSAAAVTRTFDAPVTFAQSRTGAAGHFSTDDTANADRLDHAITYRLTGIDFGGEVYVVFFENRMRSRSDRDYNDLVIELSQTAHAPTPAAAAMGLSLLAAFTMRRKRQHG